MIQLVVILISLVVNATLSGFEMALVSVKRASLRLLEDGGDRRAGEALRMRSNLERTLASIQVGITLAAIVSGAMVGQLTDKYVPLLLKDLDVEAGWAKMLIIVPTVLAVTIITVVLGELVPKSLSARHPTTVLFLLTGAVRRIDTVFQPVIRALEKSTLAIVRLIDFRTTRLESPELAAAEEAFAIHKLSRSHRAYVLNLVNIEKLSLAQVMLPWSEVTKIDVTMPQEAVLEVLLRTGHTRVPVMDGHKVLGLLNAKLFLGAPSGRWQELVRPIVTVNELARPLSTLRLLQSKRSHMCIVIDATTNEPLGIATIEDILEEIVGDIYDEDD